ncbi:aldehyde dehydrogenase family protein [Pseudonocardia endophytica]|nr:aldehyde dehydrogenase family protein [Pseudonocardia endophytica]
MRHRERAAVRRERAGIRERYGLHVGGRWIAARDGSRSDSVDPTTEEATASVAVASAADVDGAVAAGIEAAPRWWACGWQERASRIAALADLVAEHAGELARIDAVDAGIPVDGMAKDVANGVNTLRYFAGLAGELKGQTIEVPGPALNMTLREPFGVVGRIVPFNHPVQFAASGIAAPLAAGNVVVLKPGETTPISALRLAELAEGVLPPGVLNVVTGGREAGAALVDHPAVGRIAFTGSVRSGQAVVRSAAERLKTVTLELGGKNPLVVFPDADVETAARAAVTAMNFNRGQAQSCGSPSRMLIHERIRRDFVDAFVAAAEALTVGDPLDPGVAMGPLAFESHYRRVLGYVDRGVSEGARLVTGGPGRPTGLSRGYFVAPTVFDDVTPDMIIAREEIFGPVVAVLGWTDEDEALRIANELPLGLTANLWTNDLGRAVSFGKQVQAGYVWVNGAGERPLGAPFGGYKLSGLGSENSLDELLSFTRTKNLSLRAAPGGAA